MGHRGSAGGVSCRMRLEQSEVRVGIGVLGRHLLVLRGDMGVCGGQRPHRADSQNELRVNSKSRDLALTCEVAIRNGTKLEIRFGRRLKTFECRGEINNINQFSRCINRLLFCRKRRIASTGTCGDFMHGVENAAFSPSSFTVPSKGLTIELAERSLATDCACRNGRLVSRAIWFSNILIL
jgi:hypothetical protein